MLFAKVDVCLAVHPKFCAAGPAAVGYWVAALAYSCGQELDGRIPEHAIGAILALGPKKGRALCAKLVSVGLFEPDGDGYLIAKFAEKNATKAELEARRKETAQRMAVHRRRTGEACAMGDAIRDAGGDASQGPSRPPSREGVVLNSLSLDLRSRSESEDLNALSRAREGSCASPDCAPIPPDLRLTPEARASAEMLGVRDVDGEWVKFVAHHRANGTRAADFYALWTKWAVMARNYERRDREREARRTSGAAAPAPAPYHPGGQRRPEVDLGAQLKARLAAAKPPNGGSTH
jgi:hypothetical protein